MSDPLTYNRYRTAKVLMALHPELTEENVDQKISELLHSGDLKIANRSTWVIDRDSLKRYEHKIYRDNEEVRKRIVLEILEAIERLDKKIDKLEKDLPQIISDKLKELQESEKVKWDS